VTVRRLKSALMTGAFIGFSAVGLGGCLTLPEASRTLEDHADLLEGTAVFEESVSLDEAPDVDMLAVTDEMVEFLDREIGTTRIPSVRFRRMFKALVDDGYFKSSYVADSTRTAAETFESKSGNCLSYTNLFIALAREAGLDAHYQIVQVPPSWDADSGYLIRYTHINVVMSGFVYDTSYGEDFSVDFNDVLPDPDYPRSEISDDEAKSLFYANRSVALIRAGDRRAAFAHLKKAISLAPDNSDLWINLGAFYSKTRAYDEAVRSYEVALYHDPSSRAAMSGLGRAHMLVGNAEEAEKYSDQVRRYRDKNPYYHYALAQAEFEGERYDQALNAINAAIELRYRNGRFHFLKGLTEYKLGELDAAQLSFRRADKYGNYRDLKQRYVREVADAQPLG